MRKSGDIIFADVTISLRGDVSFDRAHEISSDVEINIKQEIPNCSLTVHFEPIWEDVPRNSKISSIASSVKGVKEIHNVNSYSSGGKIFVTIHVMVDRQINLETAHKISEVIETKIQNDVLEIEHVTIHLEPYVTLPENLKIEGSKTEDKIKKILGEYSEIKKVSRIATFHFKDIKKIEIDCSFDGDLSIEKVHDLTSKIEQRIRGHFINVIITVHPEPI